jgi:hypothetical protein
VHMRHILLDISGLDGEGLKGMVAGKRYSKD